MLRTKPEAAPSTNNISPGRNGRNGERIEVKKLDTQFTASGSNGTAETPELRKRPIYIARALPIPYCSHQNPHSDTSANKGGQGRARGGIQLRSRSPPAGRVGRRNRQDSSAARKAHGRFTNRLADQIHRSGKMRGYSRLPDQHTSHGSLVVALPPRQRQSPLCTIARRANCLPSRIAEKMDWRAVSRRLPISLGARSNIRAGRALAPRLSSAAREAKGHRVLFLRSSWRTLRPHTPHQGAGSDRRRVRM